MPHITDVRFEALRAQLPLEPPTTNDLLFAWTLTQGGSGDTLNDRIYSMLIAQGATPGHVNDMWGQVLAAQGFPGPTLTDQFFGFWQAGGSFGPDIDHYLLEDFITDSYLLEDGSPDLYLIDGAPFIAAKSAPGYGASENELSTSNPGGAGTPRLDMVWKPDGTRVFSCRQDNEIAQNDVSPAFGIQPGDWTNLVTTANFNQLRSIWWSPDGTKLSLCLRVASFNMRVTVHDQSATPFDLAVLGASVTKTFPVIPALSGGPADHSWSADGLTFFVHYQSVPSSIYDFSVTVPFDPTTLISPQNSSFDFLADANFSITTYVFSTDGNFLYAMDGQFLVSWDLSPPFAVASATNFQTGPTVAGASLSIPRGLDYRADTGDISVQGDQNLKNVAWFR